PLSTVDFYLNVIIGEATSIVENDCVKQAPIGIENLNRNKLYELHGRKRKTQKLEDRFQELYDHVYMLDKNLFIFLWSNIYYIFSFIPMNSTCYDDSTKDHSGPAACQGNIVKIV
ncbi:unnamed protein product, partial [Rotaria socialis]